MELDLFGRDQTYMMLCPPTIFMVLPIKRHSHVFQGLRRLSIVSWQKVADDTFIWVNHGEAPGKSELAQYDDGPMSACHRLPRTRAQAAAAQVV